MHSSPILKTAFSVTPCLRGELPDQKTEMPPPPSTLKDERGVQTLFRGTTFVPHRTGDEALKLRDNGRTRAALLLRSGNRLGGDVRRGADEESFQPAALPLWRRGARLLFPFTAKT